MTRDVGDRGVATLWAAGAIAVLVSMAIFGLHLGQALITRHHAEAAADLAALAGAAQALPGEQYACSQARRVTDRMRVQLVSCHLRDWDVLIDVSARPPGWLGTLGSVTAQARAGPTPPPTCRTTAHSGDLPQGTGTVPVGGKRSVAHGRLSPFRDEPLVIGLGVLRPPTSAPLTRSALEGHPPDQASSAGLA
ncbi:MAG TPA: Rv3654c family TadE-like protein, partial [Pseudonocardiaceae bacterium]|nr:Rv3654c family TadE-like protein [Pseudonocardiaceae bacterium]